MVYPVIGFPPEADNSDLEAKPVMHLIELFDLFERLMRLQRQKREINELVDFDVQGRLFRGRIRLRLMTGHLSVESKQRSTLYWLGGLATQLDVNGNEIGPLLHVGGTFDFIADTPGNIRIWHERSPHMGMLDAS